MGQYADNDKNYEVLAQGEAMSWLLGFLDRLLCQGRLSGKPNGLLRGGQAYLSNAPSHPAGNSSFIHPFILFSSDRVPFVAAADTVGSSGGGHFGAQGPGLPHIPGLQFPKERLPTEPRAAERAAAEDDNYSVWSAADCERLVGHRAPHQLLWRLAHGVRSLP